MSSSARIRLTKIMSQQMGPKKPKTYLDRAINKHRWNIVRGDKVQVIDLQHNDKGKQGIVLRVIRKFDEAIVEGINIITKQIRGDPQRGIIARTIRVEKPIKYSALNLVDPITNQPTRINYKVLDDGTKVRVSKKSGAIIPRPSILSVRKRPMNAITTSSCTVEEDVWSISYQPKTI